jgi:hypothetical protein
MNVKREYLEWFNGIDCGISSKTIMSILTDIPYDRYDIPADIGDFGRCYRMLKLFPELRKKLNIVYDKYKPYRPLIDCWLQLEKLYLECGEFDKLDFKIQEKRKKLKDTPYNEFRELMQKLQFASRYIDGMYPQGNDRHYTNVRKLDMFD